MIERDFSSEDFEKDCLAVFEKLLQGYKRANQTSTWESDMNALVDKLTHLPTDPFSRKLMELFDYHYLVLSKPIEKIIGEALEWREQMKHAERFVTVNQKYFSLPFLQTNTYIKKLEVFNHDGELCYRQTGVLRLNFKQILKRYILRDKTICFQDLISFKQKITQRQELEIYFYSPIVDLSSTTPSDYYRFFCDYYGKTQFLNYFKTKAKDIPEKVGGQFFMSSRIDKILSLSSSQQVLWAYFLFRLLGLKLRLNFEASMLARFLLILNRTETDDYRNTYYYKLSNKAPFVKEGKTLIVELEKTRMLFKEANLPTDDIDEVITKLLID